MKQLHDDFYYRDAYASRRNKRIAIRRALYTLGVLIAVWGLVWLTL
jgi:hypothetical protein